MNEKYPFKDIENKWRNRWEANGTNRIDLKQAKQPFYNLMMFPYPSAEGLHVGNVFAFVGSDIQGRFHRMQGYDVFEPMGFDAFGIHSENFAIKQGDHPARMIPLNIRHFRENQLERIGNMFDWSHVIDTTSPEYYRWTQWIFIQLYKAGLAYKTESAVSYCPSCKTTLASEQVIDGQCERCDTDVTRKKMSQWFLRITDFAQQLLDNLEDIDWSEKTKTAQRNWIGRSEGATIRFNIRGHDDVVDVFTTRPDTLYGVTYMVFAPEHPLLDRIVSAEQCPDLERYRALTNQLTDVERQANVANKTGVFTGAYAVNPVNNERIPIWASDYVLMEYGTGAIMAVPAHDQRDFEFASKFGLEIREVITPDGNLHDLQSAYTDRGILINSEPFNNLDHADGGQKIVEWLAKKGLAEPHVQYRLRDWCISRQRYWGPPIPIIYCDDCGMLPVPEEDLPVLLPEIEDYMPDGSENSPLKRSHEFYHCTCPACDKPAVRETDVSDNFLCSAWYFYRYPSSDINDRIFDKSMIKKWLPVNLYVGGHEHAVLHLLYSRFLCKAFRKIGLIDFEEPFKKFVANGLLVRDGAKMSKSKGNVINPEDYINRYGTDAFRTYLMFMGSYLDGGDFSDTGMKAMFRFVERSFTAFHNAEPDPEEAIDSEIRYWQHRTIKRVTEDIQRFSYNTAISRLMEFFSHITKANIRHPSILESFILLFSPFAPHLCEELWEEAGHSDSIFDHPWPEYNAEYTQKDRVEYVIQINGKVRGKIKASRGLLETELEALWRADPMVMKWIEDRNIIKTVFVPDKLVNIVIEKS